MSFFVIAKFLGDGSCFYLEDGKNNVRKYSSYGYANSAMKKYLGKNQITDTANWSVVEVFDSSPVD